MTKCPLCQSMSVAAIAGGYHCAECDFIFKDSRVFLTKAQQKKRYDQHQNQANDDGYLKSLKVLWEPLKIELQKRGLGRGLDYGSGPNPVLADIMRADGFEVDIYDFIYAPYELKEKYDFVTATEVIEHLENPQKEISQIASLLKPGGIFAGLTQFHSGPEKFKDWWYQRDQTHVGFYSDKSLRTLAKKYNFEILITKSPLFILQRLEPPTALSDR